MPQTCDEPPEPWYNHGETKITDKDLVGKFHNKGPLMRVVMEWVLGKYAVN